MTTRYRVEYALKTHRRDQLIEWIKGLLAVPFVLVSQHASRPDVPAMAANAHERYAQIMQDVEHLISDHISHQLNSTPHISKLKRLVPSVGVFFTPLPLQKAFAWQDKLRCISSRRFVAPSFNDIRLILNTAQVMSLVKDSELELVTFDGDVTLYEDGHSLSPDNPVIVRLMTLMRKGIRVGIVTAAGYTEAEKYYERLYGLLDAVAASEIAQTAQLVVMGGESSYMFAYSPKSPWKLEAVPWEEWKLPEMSTWSEDNIVALLDVAEAALQDCINTLQMPVSVMRKERAVGIYPAKGTRLAREQLEETVLVTQRTLDMHPVGKKIPWCAFNGGNDVFVDIGNKKYGVRACQRFFGGIEGSRSLHVGDQFLSAGANDFKAREASATAWIASPAETVQLLDEIEWLSLPSPP